MQNGPRRQGFSIGVLEFGSKVGQTRDRYLGAESGMGSEINKGEDTVKGWQWSLRNFQPLET